jgi:hypothetical protein
MKYCIKLIAISTLFCIALNATEPQDCIIGGEQVPQWVCQEHTLYKITGIGISKTSALLNALAELALSLGSTFSTDSKTFQLNKTSKEKLKVSKENAKICFKNNIYFMTQNESFTRKLKKRNATEELFVSKSSLKVYKGKKNLYTLSSMSYSDIIQNDEKTNESISQVIEDKNLNIQTIMKNMGITVIKRYTDSEFDEYLLFNFDKTKIIKCTKSPML